MNTNVFSTDLLNNHVMAGEKYFVFYDPNEKQFVSHEGDCEEAPEGWILLPYREELLPSFGRLVDEFLDKYGYDIPAGNVKRADYLRKKGLYYEFQEYQESRLEESAKKWCEQHEVPA